MRTKIPSLYNQLMPSIFSKIINGEIPSHKIAENDLFFAFLDIRPISDGHTLVIPKIEIDSFFDLPQEYLSNIMPFSKPIVQALEACFPCLRVGSIIAGLEVPHAHLHLIPIVDMRKFSFEFAKEAPQDTLAKQADMLRKQLLLLTKINN